MKIVPQTTKYITKAPNRSFKIVELKFPFWKFLFSDQYILPKVKIKIRNTGGDIETAQIPIYMGLLDNTNTVNNLIGYRGVSVNVHTEYIKTWRANQVKIIKFRISADQIQPNSYFLYARVEEYFEVSTTITEQISQIKNFSMEKAEEARIISDLEQQRILNKFDVVKYHEGIELAQIYIGKAIKVNSFGNTLTLILTILGVILAGLAIQWTNSA